MIVRTNQDLELESLAINLIAKYPSGYLAPESDTPFKIHLYRGPSAKYNWEITVGSKSTEEAVSKVKELDSKLTKEYGSLGPGDKAPSKRTAGDS